MDISDSLSTNNSVLDETMGSILSTSNENETENDPTANITAEESNLTSQNIEVNDLQNTTESENIPDTTLDNVESYTETLSEQDINLIIMGKPSASDPSEEISSTVKSSLLDVPSTSHIEEHEELWLGDNTRQLVKVDTDEDFEVIVKSLETAIVETERYDIDTVITSNDEPVLTSVASNLENSLGMSIIEADGNSLLDDIPSNLLTSAVPPLPLQGIQDDEQVEMSSRILASTVERPITQHRNLDNYDEFATISEPKVESFDEQSSSLFEVMEPEIDVPIENEPSLLELQEATMPTDISEEFQQDIDTPDHAIFSNTAVAVENINTEISDLDEICEASVDSEFAEKQFIVGQIDSDTSNSNEECLEKPTKSLKIVDEKLNIKSSTETKNSVPKIDTSKIENKTFESEENIDIQSSQLEDIFEINPDTNFDIEENIITSTQLENTSDTNDDVKYVENTLIFPELPPENISKTNEEVEVLSSTINTELNVGVEKDTKLSENQESEDETNANDDEQLSTQNIVQELQMNKEPSTDISEKQECAKSNEKETIDTKANVIEEQNKESEVYKSKINIECKSISLEEDINIPEAVNDLKISAEGSIQSDLIENTGINIKNKTGKILLTKEIVAPEVKQREIIPQMETQNETIPPENKQTETFSPKKIQQEIMPVEETQKEAVPSKETQKDIVPPKETTKETVPADETLKEIVKVEETQESEPTKETHKEIVAVEETPKDIEPSEKTQKETLSSMETLKEIVQADKTQNETLSSMETLKEIVQADTIQKEIVPVEETKKDEVPSEEQEKETVSPMETLEVVVLAEKTQNDIVPVEETHNEAMSPEETQKDMVLSDEIQNEIASSMESVKQIVSAEQTQKEIVTVEEAQKEAVPLEETKEDIEPSQERQKGTVLSIETLKQIVPAGKTQKEIIPVKETRNEAVSPEETQKDIVPSEKTQNEIILPMETLKEIVPTEEKQKEIIPVVETPNETVSLEEAQKDIVLSEKTQKETILPMETLKEIVPTEKIKKEIIPVVESPKETVPPEETHEDIVPSEETQIELVSSMEILKDIVSAEKSQTDIVPVEETHCTLSVKETQKDANTSTSMSIKHSLDSDEKEQSPPKKIKLVREKLQIKSVHTEPHKFNKNIESFVEHEKKIIIQEETILCKTETKVMTPEKPTEIDQKTIQIPEKIIEVEGKETMQQILEKLDDPLDKNTNENKSPVRAQKLKLQRNYKLPQKSVKSKVNTKNEEELVSTSTEKIVAEEIKIASIAQDKTIKVSSKEDVEGILQPSISKTEDTTLETEISVFPIESNEPVIIKELETKSVQLDVEIDHPIETVSTSEISKSSANVKIIDAVTTVQEILSSTEEVILESIEEKSMNSNPIDNQVNLEEIQETHTVDISKDVKDFTEKENKPETIASDNQMVTQINQVVDFTETLINMETESTELKAEEANLSRHEVLIDKTGKEEEQIANIETKNQELDLVSSEVEKKEEPENKILVESKEESSEFGIISVEQKASDVGNLKSFEIAIATSAETIDVVDKIVDENETNLLNTGMSSEKIKEPDLPDESEQISSSNIESLVENITETETESVIETKNITETKVTEEKIVIEKSFDTQKVEMKIENEEIGDTKHSQAKNESVNIVDKQELEDIVKTKSIVDTEKPKKKINKYETSEIIYGTDKMIPESKNDKLLTIDTQFPLLSSRLQERLESKPKVTPVALPTVSQESVSKKIQQQLTGNKFIAGNITISKQDLLPASIAEFRKKETAAFLAQNPEITLTKEITSSTTDHLATMESATKIKITKRKVDTSSSEPLAKRSVTKPLSVQIDDLESSSTLIERSHSSGTPGQREHESIPKIVIKTIPKSEGRSSPKITIKPIKPPEEMSSKSRASEESSHSPKITIKPIVKQDPLKFTITKQKTDDTHSILKIYQPEDSHDQHIPKLTIKPIPKSDEMQHSPRITIKPVKQSPSTSSMSPKITVKPIPSPNEQVEIIHSPKITVKPVVNPEESYPKVTIKPVLRPEESHKVPELSPRQMKLKAMTFESSSGVTVEPICGTGNLLSPQKLNPENQTVPLKISVKPFAKIEESLSPKLTIKPITKTCEIVQSEDGTSNPLKLTIKPILKPEETSYQSPKITIKPIVKPDEMQMGEELDKPERIILKIQKTSLPSPKERLKDTKKEPEIKIEAIPHDPEKSQRLDKIKLKLTKEGSHAQIIPSVSTISSDVSFSLKRSLGISDSCLLEKRSKTEFPGTEILHTSDISINIVQPNAKPCPKSISEEVTIMKIDKVASGSRAPATEQHISQSRFKEMLMKIQQKPDITCTPHIDAEPDYSSSSDDVKIVEVIENDPLKDPLSINDESNSQDIMIVNEVINTNPFQNIKIISAQSTNDPNLQTPKKRGRPRKNPLEVKPEIKGEDCVEVRPKRTCRAPPGRTPFAVKERKPRGAGRGRGGSRGRGASKSPQKSPKEIKSPRGKALKEAKALAKIEAARLAQEVVIDEITIEDSTNDTPAATPVPPIEDSPKKPEVKEIDSEPPPQMVEPEVKVSPSPIIEELPKQPPPSAVYEEETRMSADNSSRAQTPARQVFTAPLVEGPEESQSSVQSTATTESSKTKKGRLEVCDPDSAVTTVDQIVEYSWANGGPYMLQEQIAQYLGVKSFKRKYPGLTRRPVEMQERDYIREKGLVSESMCDMGLTAVPSSEILDIMYSDFQEKYEEYRKCLRDKQAKEISNRQKAVSLATSQEKNKIDFKERAIRSAASWNCNFNKARKETRKCCMDLQTFTVNYPAGKMKVPHKNPVGHYPIALVPGQYTDYYKSYTTNDLHYLPLNTVRYGPVLPNQRCDAGQSDGSQSDSDSSSGSDSDSSDDSMSTEEETPATIICKPASVQLTQLITTPKSKVH